MLLKWDFCRQLIDEKKFDQAQVLLSSLTPGQDSPLLPTWIDLCLKLGSDYAEDNRYMSALTVLETALRLAPDDIRLHTRRHRIFVMNRAYLQCSEPLTQGENPQFSRTEKRLQG